MTSHGTLLKTTFSMVGAMACALAFTTPAQAQYSSPPEGVLELNAHAGALKFSAIDGDYEPMVGGRVSYQLAKGFAIGGHFDWAQGGTDETDVTMYLYGGDVSYVLPSRNGFHFFLSAGVGGVTLTSDEELVEENDMMLSFGGGAKWLNHADDPSWGVRADVKDHIMHLGEIHSGNSTNNMEFSAGVSFFFGGEN